MDNKTQLEIFEKYVKTAEKAARYFGQRHTHLMEDINQEAMMILWEVIPSLEGKDIKNTKQYLNVYLYGKLLENKSTRDTIYLPSWVLESKKHYNKMINILSSQEAIYCPSDVARVYTHADESLLSKDVRSEVRELKDLIARRAGSVDRYESTIDKVVSLPSTSPIEDEDISGFLHEMEHGLFEIRDAVDSLPEKHKGLILLRMEGYSFEEIGIMKGFSKQHASQETKKALELLKNKYS